MIATCKLYSRQLLHLQKNRCFHNGLATLRNNTEFIKFMPVSALKPRMSPEISSLANSKLHSLIWQEPMRNIFVTKKPRTKSTKDAMVEFISYVQDTYPDINIIVQNRVAEEIKEAFTPGIGKSVKQQRVLYKGEDRDIVDKTDLMVSLGGDGTILHAVSMFSHAEVPPVLAFSLGTLGFLLPFKFQEYKSVFESILNSNAKCLHRSRIVCHLVRKGESNKTLQKYALNDIFVHRGNSPHLAHMDIYSGGVHLTNTIADGIVISTPTGSTAYSLSSGGSIVSPLVPSILLTPICPRSLSFRPVILPSSSHIKVVIRSKLNQNNEEQTLKLSVDGMPQEDLHDGDEVHVFSDTGTIHPDGIDCSFKATESIKYQGVYCIAKSENDWIRGINELLGFNSGFRASQKIT
ncbi:HER058Cp [Eremothecium sinecaudum]|uniref:HER058Cp n=1 Tax=Eremothecium sinecaudum TaxID=45286 RepID=A0A0X8HTQ1_9SACH|nr:HER058Cp [Eremothecium sinecaudum]AMD21337.1 HER058Cp [Eremothecium sinecaudum]